MTTGNVNLKIGSGISFNIVGGTSGLIGNRPQLQTVKTLDNVYFTTSTAFTAFYGPLLSVNVAELVDFQSIVGLNSDKQTIKITNNGNAILNITDILYTYNDDCGPRIFFSTGTTLQNGNTINITPGNTATFDLAYIGAQGVYNNYFIIISDNSSGPYKVNTHQVITTSTDLIISPAGFNTTTTQIGQIREVTYTLDKLLNKRRYEDVANINFTTKLDTNTPAWSISKIENNTVSLKFNSWEVNNVNGTYISTLTLTCGGITTSTINTATVSISTLTNKNIITWISPVAKHNSIIGVSYDLSDGVRYLTIGVGIGGNGLPIYDNGGSVYKDINAIGIGVDVLPDPYPFWSNVTKIRFTNTSQTYYSGDWQVKTTDSINYPKYFGNYDKPNSMFIVNDDGYGSITIELNYLRELTGDADFDVTLKNLTRAFHYYSNVDVLGRITPLPTEYASSLTNYTTYLFTGFNYNTKTKSASVNTSIVDLPV